MPLSQGNVPALTSSKPPTSARAPRRLVVVLGAALVVGLVAAWGVSAFRSRQRVEVVEVAAPGAAEPSAKDKEIALNEIPVTGESNQLTGDKMATCVAGYLPKGAFAKPPDVSWMCNERDPREGGMKLRSAVVQGAPAGAPTDAMKLLSVWVAEMAAFAVIRAGRCADRKRSAPIRAQTATKVSRCEISGRRWCRQTTIFAKGFTRRSADQRRKAAVYRARRGTQVDGQSVSGLVTGFSALRWGLAASCHGGERCSDRQCVVDRARTCADAAKQWPRVERRSLWTAIVAFGPLCIGPLHQDPKVPWGRSSVYVEGAAIISSRCRAPASRAGCD